MTHYKLLKDFTKVYQYSALFLQDHSSNAFTSWYYYICIFIAYLNFICRPEILYFGPYGFLDFFPRRKSLIYSPQNFQITFSKELKDQRDLLLFNYKIVIFNFPQAPFEYARVCLTGRFLSMSIHLPPTLFYFAVSS